MAVGFVWCRRDEWLHQHPAAFLLECDVSTFMNQCGSISIEYPKQVKVRLFRYCNMTVLPLPASHSRRYQLQDEYKPDPTLPLNDTGKILALWEQWHEEPGKFRPLRLAILVMLR